MDSVDAAIKKIISFSKLSAERAKWQAILEKVNENNAKFFPRFTMQISKAPLDAYFGDMGAICLSARPDAICLPNLYNNRLISEEDEQIIGMSLLYGVKRATSIVHTDIKKYWLAFAFNPLHSVTVHLTPQQQLLLYLHYRRQMEAVARKTNMAIILAGIGTKGIISNDDMFGDVIRGFEQRYAPVEVHDARGLELYYDESQFAHGLIIIDPHKPDTYRAEGLIKHIMKGEMPAN